MNWATHDGWFAMGWDDYAATYNSIRNSNRASVMRLVKWNSAIEHHLERGLESGNTFYLIGVEEALLRGRDRPAIIPPANLCIDHKLHECRPCQPCKFCGRPLIASVLTTAGILADWPFCNEHCIRQKLSAYIDGDDSLRRIYHNIATRRAPKMLPEDRDELTKHFASLPKVNIATPRQPDVPVKRMLSMKKGKKTENASGQEEDSRREVG